MSFWRGFGEREREREPERERDDWLTFDVLEAREVVEALLFVGGESCGESIDRDSERGEVESCEGRSRLGGPPTTLRGTFSGT
jgi:hypothetical protein